MARSRVIKDCERDVKGVHRPEKVFGMGMFYWCHECGALLKERYDKRGNPQGGLSRFEVLRRVQE